MPSIHRALPWLALLMLGAAVMPAAAQTTQDLARRWAEQKARQDAIDEQHRRAIDRSYWQNEMLRQQQQQQQRLDDLEAQRQQLLNDRLQQENQQIPYGYTPPPAYVVPGYAPPPTCLQYAQAYDAAGRPLGLVCVR